MLTTATLGGLTGPGTVTLSNTASSAVALSVGNNSSSTTFSGMLQGPGSLNKIGGGSLTLTGSNTYSGPTAVNQGKLIVDGWLTSSAVTVNSGGTLGGTGTLGSVTVNAGAHLNPGDLSSGALGIAGGMDFEGGELDIVGAGGSINSLSIAGNLILNDYPTLNVSGSLAIGTYTIASYGGDFSGQFVTPDLPANDTVNYGTSSDSSITLSVVPEPSAVVLITQAPLGCSAGHGGGG